MEKNPNFGVKSEIQRAKFGYLSPKFLEAKFGAPTRISEANFGAKPPSRLPNMEVTPWGFHMGIQEDWQIHAKNCFQTIKSQDSQFALQTDRTSSNKKNYVNSIILHMQQNHTPAQYTNLQRNLQSNMLMEFTYVYYPQGTYGQTLKGLHKIMRT